MIPNDLSSVSRTHITEEETQFPQVILRPIHTSTVALVSKQARSRAPHTHTHTFYKAKHVHNTFIPGFKWLLLYLSRAQFYIGP